MPVEKSPQCLSDAGVKVIDAFFTSRGGSGSFADIIPKAVEHFGNNTMFQYWNDPRALYAW